MDVMEEKSGSVLILGPKGRLDSNSSKSFEDRLLGRMEAERQVVIDFADLDYISSAGLRVLLMAAKKSKSQGAKLALCELKPQIREVFEMSGFGKLFAIAPSRADALSRVA